MTVTIYVEGGGDRERSQAPCRKGFRLLFERLGLSGLHFKVVACGPRSEAYRDFSKAIKSPNAENLFLLVDSEEPIDDVDQAWTHLARRSSDKWQRPGGATEDSVFLMTTCMETWIVADRETLKQHYGPKFNNSALPAPTAGSGQESRTPDELRVWLERATKDCGAPYRKGSHSFAILAKLNPDALRPLPSFARIEGILKSKL